jgi:2-polyprenyl-6-hydroxyphenyl methylase / 3-demethylubiquinone-9 3-methyltransferase
MSDAGAAGTVDREEVDRFARLATAWWDADGPMGPLHRMNPVRLTYVRDRACAHFTLPDERRAPLTGLRFLDVGCGGGLMCEPLARLGATVLGIDPTPEVIDIASSHADAAGLSITYEAQTVAAVADRGERFDVVLALEVVEHVPDVPLFMATLAQVVRPHGLLILSTLSRTLQSFVSAIVGAEYLLGWLPRGTHQWAAFVTPAELARQVRRAGLRPLDVTGLTYHPDRESWSLTQTPDVNYLMTATRG